MDFINQLGDFVTTPLGFILCGIGLFLIIQVDSKYPRLSWFLVAIFGFAASLGKYTDEYITEAPPLIFPLQQIRELGRPLSIVLLVLLIVIALKAQNYWRRKTFPQPIFYLILVQITIFFKLNNLSIAFLTAATFGGVVLMVILGPSRWLQDDYNFQLGVWAIAMVGVIFGLANSFQALIDLYPITFVHGWFLGTTGNPQHAAVLITATLPTYLYLFFDPPKYPWLKWIWAGLGALAILGLLATASRTGAIMALVSLLIFFRYQVKNSSKTVLILGMIAAFLLPYFDFGSTDSSVFLSSSWNKFSLGSNTREDVWGYYWQSFLENPLFGIPFEGADRLRFGESSWFSVFGALGLVGALPMFLFGWSSLQMVFQLEHLSKTRPDDYLKCSVVMAGLLSLLVGGISEAYLLGNLTFSLLAVFLYLVLGNYLLEVAEREEHLALLESRNFNKANQSFRKRA